METTEEKKDEERIKEILYGDDRTASAEMLHELTTRAAKGTLQERFQIILDEYVETVRGRSV